MAMLTIEEKKNAIKVHEETAKRHQEYADKFREEIRLDEQQTLKGETEALAYRLYQDIVAGLYRNFRRAGGQILFDKGDTTMSLLT